MPLPTVADLKQHLNVTSSTQDDELVHMLDAAVDVVEGLVGPVTPQSVTEIHRAVSSDVLVLRQTPASALDSVSSGYGSHLTSLVVDDFELDAEAGLLRRVDRDWMSGSFTVTYSAGRQSVPPAIHMGILIVASHLWETQRGTSPSPLALQGEDSPPAFGAGYAIPNRARDLLIRYMRPATLA